MSNYGQKYPLTLGEPPPSYYAAQQQTGLVYDVSQPTAPIMQNQYQDPPIQATGWLPAGASQPATYGAPPLQPYSQPNATYGTQPLPPYAQQPYAQQTYAPYVPQAYVQQPQPQTIIVADQNYCHDCRHGRCRTHGQMSEDECCCLAILGACCLACCLANNT